VYLLLAIAKAVSIRDVTMEQMQALQSKQWFKGAAVAPSVAEKISDMLKSFDHAETAHLWAVVQAEARERIGSLAAVEMKVAADPANSTASVDLTLDDPSFWLTAGSLLLVDDRTIAAMAEAAEVQRSGTILMCDNHADGVTEAAVTCDACKLNLCAECDHVIHLPKSKRSHPRNQVAKKGTEIDVSRDDVSTTAFTKNFSMSFKCSCSTESAVANAFFQGSMAVCGRSYVGDGHFDPLRTAAEEEDDEQQSAILA
jgi:hypothetical protein